ncbi:MAG TPA: 3-beta hydroxysteroid dehydrogenase, partial [Planctomycetes bacterium]|nr:3-beta hydroxysteroid dehydrogenase [Planctomycetota bacterium]
KLKLIKRAGTRIDATYIDNVIDAHIAAFDSLSIGSTCSGKTYFIANDEPMAPHQLIGGILQAAGLDPVEPTISPATAWALGAVLEWVHRTGFWSGEPLLTRFIARQLATSHWFDLSAARRDLGWEPRISTEQGLQRLAKSFSPTSEPVL